MMEFTQQTWQARAGQKLGEIGRRFKAAAGRDAPYVAYGTLAGLIDINLATQADLEMLPGIGPTTAANIIAHREANGPFATIEAIMDVPGIGEGKFAAMKDLITVGP